MAQLNSLLVNGDARVLGNLYAKNKANKETGVFYIEGTGSTAGTWLGSHDDITSYYPGLMIVYKVGVAGLSSGTTLNINSLGSVTVVRNATTAVSTAFPVNSVVFLTYTEDSGTAYWKVADYDTNTKTTTGSSNKTGTKMFLIGGTSQSSSGVTTYSNTNCYIGTDNCLYSGGAKVATSTEVAAATYTHPSYTARTGKPTVNQTPAFGGTATVSQITSDATGHVTGATDRTITIPSTLSNGTGTAGLIKTSSTVTSSSGYTACPVINGVPYYKDTNNTYSLSSFGITATAAELNKLDGVTATATELNYVDGVTSNIQTQLNGKAASSHGTHVPSCSTSNNGQFLRVINGAAAWSTVTNAEGVSF